jgi:DNA-binding transcriptional ArsR family regulator
VVPNVAKVAALIGDPVRSRMLFAMLDGRELTASELAFRGESSPQAASAHLAKLLDGGLIRARSAGRQRLFRLASGEIAHAIEVLASIAPVTPVTSLNQHTAMHRLRRARSCYDHLAGRLGVSVTEALISLGAIAKESQAFAVTPRGEQFFHDVGIDLDTVRASRRHFARACMDWTERRYHIAGALGAALLDRFVEKEWLVRNTRDRSLEVTTRGQRNFAKVLGLRSREP